MFDDARRMNSETNTATLVDVFISLFGYVFKRSRPRAAWRCALVTLLLQWVSEYS
jgi:hypothetical protein